MDLTDEQQKYLEDMSATRGYVLDYHRMMVMHDFELLVKADQMIRAAYLDERSLSRRTKELIFIATLTVMRAPKPQLESHIRVALSLGLSPQEILEAIEICLPEAGVVAFQAGVEAWSVVIESSELGEPKPDGVVR